MPVYIFERINIIGGGRGRFVEMVRRRLAAHMQAKHRVGMVGVWATAGSTAAWPEANILWEMDNWAHFSKALAGQHPMEERDPYGLELWRQALDVRSGGESMLLIASRFTPTLEQLRSQRIAGPVYLYEEVRTLPGKMNAYHAALETEYLPIAKARGLTLVGAYWHAIRPNVGMNLWALSSWSHAAKTYGQDEGHAGAKRWRKRCADLLEHQAGWLIVPPPQGALRT